MIIKQGLEKKVSLTCAIGKESDNHVDKSLRYSLYKFLWMHRVWMCALLTLVNYVFFRLLIYRVSCVFAGDARRHFLSARDMIHSPHLIIRHRLEAGTWYAVYSRQAHDVLVTS